MYKQCYLKTAVYVHENYIPERDDLTSGYPSYHIFLHIKAYLITFLLLLHMLKERAQMISFNSRGKIFSGTWAGVHI